MSPRKLAAILAALGITLAGATTIAVVQKPDPPPPAPTALRQVHSPRTVTDDMHLAPGTCTYGTSNGQPLPDPTCTPGAIDPTVTQDTIDTTICVPGWTATVRPSSSVTARFEKLSAAAYVGGVTTGEYDHLVPLELGGANSTSNLWPEPGKIPNGKDTRENALKSAVCAGRTTLEAAQRAIATDWTTAVAP